MNELGASLVKALKKKNIGNPDHRKFKKFFEKRLIENGIKFMKIKINKNEGCLEVEF